MPFPVERAYLEEAGAKLVVRFPAAFVGRTLRTNGEVDRRSVFALIFVCC